VSRMASLRNGDHARALAPRLTAAIAGTRISSISGRNEPPKLTSGRMEIHSAFAQAFYLANSHCGSLAQLAIDADEAAVRAQVLDWLLRVETGLYPAVAGHVFSQLDLIKDDGPAGHYEDELKRLNQHLAGRTFLVEERLSVADVCAATCFILLERHEPLYDDLPHIRRWLATILAQRGVEEVLREFWGTSPKGRRSVCIRREHQVEHHSRHGHETHQLVVPLACSYPACISY